MRQPSSSLPASVNSLAATHVCRDYSHCPARLWVSGQIPRKSICEILVMHTNLISKIFAPPAASQHANIRVNTLATLLLRLLLYSQYPYLWPAINRVDFIQLLKVLGIFLPFLFLLIFNAFCNFFLFFFFEDLRLIYRKHCFHILF